MPDPTDRVLQVAQEAGRGAARLCRAVLAEAPRSPEAMVKLGKEPVTAADYGSQALILHAVAEAFPGHGILAEEGAAHLREHASAHAAEQIQRLVGHELGRPASMEEIYAWIDHKGDPAQEFVWTIDPIDGTKGFVRREQYAVAIGVLRAGAPWAGVLVCPNLPVDPAQPAGGRGVLFAAARGRGATAAPLDGGPPRPVHVSDFADPARVRVLGSVESAHGDPRILRAVVEDLSLRGGVVRMDSQVKYAAVARGEAEIYLRPQSSPERRENVWDHAAGVVVTEEAGGRVTDLDGRPLDFSHGRKLARNRGVLGTNGAVHDLVLESLARIAAAF